MEKRDTYSRVLAALVAEAGHDDRDRLRRSVSAERLRRKLAAAAAPGSRPATVAPAGPPLPLRSR